MHWDILRRGIPDVLTAGPYIGVKGVTWSWCRGCSLMPAEQTCASVILTRLATGEAQKVHAINLIAGPRCHRDLKCKI